ncbi:MAG: flippase, partial [Nanoarchaeota archaeon]|nr:flippase [Nanoarchaeota archaeon]
MNYTKKAIKGTSIIFVLSIFSALFAYLLRILLARNLTVAEYGALYAIMALFGLFSIFQSLGLGEGLTKYVAEFETKKRLDKIKSSIIIVFSLQFFSTILLGLIFIFLSNFIAKYYFHDLSMSIYIKVYAISIMLSPLLNIFKAIFSGFQRMFFFSLLDLLQVVAVLIFSFVLLKLGLGLMAPFLAYVLLYTISILFYFIFIKKVFPSFWKIKYAFDYGLVKRLIKFGTAVILASAAGLVFGYTDTFLITLLRPLEEVGIYNASFPTAKMLWGLSGALTLILFPLTSELWAKQDSLRIQDGIRLLYKFSLISILPVSFLFIVFPETILTFLFSSSYVAGANVLRILAFGTVIFTLSQVNNSVLMGIGKPKSVSKIMLFAAGFNLVGNLVLIPTYGISGAAVSTVVSFLIVLIFSYLSLNKI